MGRPSEYTDEIANSICEQLVEGISLRTICKAESMPSISSVFNWFQKFPAFLEQYARAKEIQAEGFAEELMDIADDGTNDFVEREDKKGNVRVMLDQENILRSKLRVDTRKWVVSKLLSKKYGDKLEHSGPEGGPIQFVVTRAGGKEK